MIYGIICSENTDAFVKDINKALKKGWKLYGDTMNCTAYNGGLLRNEIVLMQAVVKEELTELEEFCKELETLSEEQLRSVYSLVDLFKREK
jgi:hypothetical protein